MDAEKFDKIVLDLLYDELDELTRASAQRHMDQSARARALYSELRATRQVGALPLTEPPPDLTERILRAEAEARAGRSLRQRAGALVSILAGYTMRPQLAMAAILMLMLGSSLLLLRVKPGEPNSVSVTERGVPESDKESVAIVQVAPERPAPPSPNEEAPADRRRSVPRAEREALPQSLGAKEGPPMAPPAAASPTGDEAAAEGALAGRRARSAAPNAGAGAGVGEPNASKSEEARSACRAELERYEALAGGASSGRSEAAWSAAQCYLQEGRTSRARETYRSLLGDPAYSDRARMALSRMSEGMPRADVKAAAKATAEARPGAAPPPATSDESP